MAQYTPFTFTADFTPQDHDKYIQEVIQGIEMQGMNEATQRIVQEMLYRSANATGQPIISYTRLWLTELSAHINTTLAQLFEKIDKDVGTLTALLESTVDRQDRQDEEIKQLRNIIDVKFAHIEHWMDNMDSRMAAVGAAQCVCHSSRAVVETYLRRHRSAP